MLSRLLNQRRCSSCQWVAMDTSDEPCWSCDIRTNSNWERSNWSIITTILLLAGLTVAILEACRWLTR